MSRVCSIAGALEIVGEKWSLLVIRELFLGVRRFGEIQEQTGAPRDILTDRLRKLEGAGVIERRQYSEHPPRHEYHLTPAGHQLFGAITMLREWGDACADQKGPDLFAHTCGAELHTRLVCDSCGEPVTERSVRITPNGKAASRAATGA